MGDKCACPYWRTMDFLGRRHALTLIWLLQQESPRRFNDIKRELDVNPVTLSQRLTELEEQGIVHRQAFNEMPPRVEYSLTPKGMDLIPVMEQLCDWAARHDTTEAPPIPA